MKKLRVLLVVPPNSMEERYGKLKFVGTMYPSMGLAAIGAITEQAGFSVKVIDCEAENLGYDELEEKIKVYKPDIIGMQTFCNTINRALEIAKRVKENINPKIKIVLGGVQATLFPQKYINNKFIDFIVVGEGEIVFENLLNALENKTDFSHIKGLAWKKDQNFFVNPLEEHIKDIDALPFPARHLFDLKLYHPSAQLRGKKTFHIVTSRGCPYRCGFCSCHKTFGHTYRFNKTDRVIKEIKYLKEKHQIDGLHFYDDTLTINKQRIHELCDKMIKEKINLGWACFTRVNCVDQELLNKMSAAGCYQIFYGVEAANQRLLNVMKKDITIEQIKNAFKWTKNAGIEALASFIVGLPTETEKEARATLEFAKEIDADYAHWEIYTPHPGTNLYNIALEHGELLSTDLNKYSPWSDEPVYRPYNRTIKELKYTKDLIFRKFYLRPIFLLKRIKNLLKLPPNRIWKLIESGFVMVFSK